MNNRRITLENIAFLAALLLAFGVRLAALEKLPLIDSEAELALQALSVAEGNRVQLAAQPGYILPTALLFYLFESSITLARLIPALAGGLLAFAPFLYRRQLGRFPALLLAFFLAIDPGLVAVSRQAGGAMLTVSFTFFALGFWLNRRMLPAGILSGLALLGGPALWPGLLILLVIWLIWPRNTFDTNMTISTADRRLAAIAALATVFVVGTQFFTIPTGLSAAAGSLPEYLRSWVKSSDVPATLPLLALVFYSLPGLLAGVWGALFGLLKSESIDRALAAALVVSILLIVLNPGRQVVDLVWTLPLMWALAARQAARLLPLGDQDLLPALAQAVLSFVLVVFAWMNFAAVYMPSPGNSESLVRLAAVAGALMLLLLSSLLMGVGWSWLSMRTGLAWGLGAALLLFMISAGANATGLTGSPGMEMWQTGGGAENATLVSRTVGDLAMWQHGDRQITDVTVAGVQSPALRWALRDIREVTLVDYLPVEAQASVVITQQQDSLSLVNPYRGQDFSWDEQVQWSAMKLEDWFVWLLARQAPTSQSTIVVWARTDIFAGGAEPQLEQQNP